MASSSNNTDYLRFSAYSLKELITRKLASETKFTDQIYEGSNLAILIDIVCYMYQCLMYNINNAAAEAMWSDTQVYENINRLAKLIGYNPKGATAATATFIMSNATDIEANCVIPRYAVIDTKQTDDNGKKIYYSTCEDINIDTSGSTPTILCYNGIWRMYATIYTASGQASLTILLDQLTSDNDKQTYVPSDKIDVYIKYKSGTADIVEKWEAVQYNLFINSSGSSSGSSLYNSNDKVFNVRLNEEKQYEITFGNGLIGKIPTKDASIYIFYLDSNGPYGSIDLGDVQDAKIKHDASIFGLDDDTYSLIFNNADDDDYLATVKESAKWENNSSSTLGDVEESVESIRLSGPSFFKSVNKLVTASDWEYYIKNKFKDNVLDVKCQNNWTYISSFYRWLYNLGTTLHSNPTYYLSKSRFVKHDYKWADAHDSNNVYLWVKMRNDADIYKNTISNAVQNIKMITQEPVFVKPLDVQFAFCALDIDEVREQLKNGNTSFDGNYLEITLHEDGVYSNTDITSQVMKIIKEYFDETNFTIGGTINNNDLVNSIYAIGSVTRIRTVYKNDETGIVRIFPGISFASWTSDLIDLGDDLDITTTIKTLESFLFPNLYSKTISSNKIVIIKKTIGSVSSILY